MKFFTKLFLVASVLFAPVFGAQAVSPDANSGLSLTSNMLAPSTAYSNTNISSSSADDEDGFTIGGALRYNIASQHYESDATAASTYATMDTWRLNVSGQSGDISLNFEYRFYPTFNTHFIKQGWLGYDFSDDLHMQLGVTQVPFGNLMYNSHSWWFNLPYYMGLEDDFNMGVKFSYDVSDEFNIMAAYFRQQEPAGPAYGSASFGGPGAGTYSYNVIPDDAGALSSTGVTSSIQDWNQFNVRAAYQLGASEIGVSGKLKGIYNSVLDETEYGHAVAAHADINVDNFNIILQFINYDYDAKDDAGNSLDRVQMGAYGDPYYGDGVASAGNIVTAGVAYTHAVDWGPITSIQPYIDYSYMTKDGSLQVAGQSYDFEDTHMLVPGFLISAGSVFTYVDLAMGKNQPWLTDSFGTGMGAGHLDANGVPIPVEDLDWNVRFNINIGYYF